MRASFDKKNTMQYSSKYTHLHSIRILKIFVVIFIFSLTCEKANGQMSSMGAHHPDYEVATNLHNGASDTSDEDDLNNESTGLNPNGEILAPKSFPLSGQEPTCEELRAMWIFSKRQSRAAEMSNEIPTYRDPFAYNVWEPIYPAGRGIGSRMMSRFREPSRPVFGRVISREPVVVQRLPVRARVFDDVSRMYGSESRSAIPALPVGLGPRRYLQYRFSGTPYNSAQASNSGSSNQNAVHQGSFQKLKELIWTERAKELTQQRKAEEMAARAAALKEITAGQHIKTHLEERGEPDSKEENLSPDQEHHYQHNTDSRISIANAQSGVAKSIFSGNPSSNSARSARLLLPSMIGEVGDRGNSPKNFPLRPSHFRERNRVLFRQSTPSDFYQRESRNEHIRSDNEASKEHQLDLNMRFHKYADDRDNTVMTDDSNNYGYRAALPYDNELQSTGIQQQLGELYRKLFQLDNLSYPEALPQEKLNYDNNIVIEGNRRHHGRKFNDYSELAISNDVKYY